MHKIAVINGPNMNMLNKRQKKHYGNKNLSDIKMELNMIATKNEVITVFFQSNHEGEIVDYIHENYRDWDGLIINPAGLTHTSIVLRDAVELLDIPVVEVHLSNIYKRENFRKKSVLSDVVNGQVCGLGSYSYSAALNYLANIINKGENR